MLKYKKSCFIIITLALTATLIAVVGQGCRLSPASGSKVYQKSRFLMGTIVNISVVSDQKKIAMTAIDQAFQVLRDIENQASMRIPSSFTSQINQAAGHKDIIVSPSFMALIKKSLECSRLTQGAFDVTIGSISQLYHFEDGQGTLPAPEAIRQKLPLVDYHNIHLDETQPGQGTVGLSRVGAMIDLGGVAKGFAVDQAVKSLRKNKIKAGIVNAGGDIRLFGYKPGHKIWNIGIQHPRQSNKVIASVELTNTSIVTSGDYERFFIKDNIRYHHILEPKTGQPARGCQSVTIVSETALEGDALSTGVFILGPEKGMALIERLSGVEGLIIDQAGQALISSGLRSQITWRSAINMRENNH